MLTCMIMGTYRFLGFFFCMGGASKEMENLSHCRASVGIILFHKIEFTFKSSLAFDTVLES